MNAANERLLLAGHCQPPCRPERRLHSAGRPSRREGLLWIVEAPFSAGDREVLEVPLRSIDLAQS